VVVLQLGSPGPVPLELVPNEKYTLEACEEPELLSMMNPLVPPAEFAGTATACVTAVGGNVNGGVTFRDITQPILSLRQLPAGIGLPVLALAPILKKIQSVEVVVL
jgi:hypothetical protein